MILKRKIDYNILIIKLFFCFFIFNNVGCVNKEFTGIVLNNEILSNNSFAYSVNEHLNRRQLYFDDNQFSHSKFKVVFPLAISIGDTAFYFLESDTFKILKTEDRFQLEVHKKANQNYNHFLSDLTNKVDFKNFRLFFYDKSDSIINNPLFIFTNLSKYDKEIHNIIFQSAEEYNISDEVKQKVLVDYLVAKKISLAYSYINASFQSKDKKKMYLDRLISLIYEIDKLSLDEFLRNDLNVILLAIFSRLTNHSITNDKSVSDIKNHLDWIQKNLVPTTLSYQYLIVALKNKATILKIANRNSLLNLLNKQAKKSPFYFLLKYYHYNHKKDFKSNDPKDKGYYSFDGKDYSLETIINRYSNSPVLIDFWASWCGPCIDAFPAIDTLKQKYPQLSLLRISLDKEAANWKIAVMKYNIDKNTTFRINTAIESEFDDRLVTIPKYAFLEKNGKFSFFENLTDMNFQIYLSQFIDNPRN